MASVSITKPDKSNIKQTTATFSGSLSLTQTSTTWETYVSVAGNGATVTGSYSNGTLSLTANNLTAGAANTFSITVTYKVQIYTADETLYYFNYSDGKYTYKSNGYSSYERAYSARVDMEEQGYNTSSIYSETSYSWKNQGNKTVESNSITIYTKGNEFKFKFDNLNTETNQWDVSTNLVTNVGEFNIAAKVYNAWRAQSGEAIAGGLNTGKLTAANLNAVYTNIDGSSKYEAGDKVTRAMFTGLENIVNS